MKKLFLFAIGATAMLASCSNEEDVQMVNDGDKVRIELNATTNQSLVGTKAPINPTEDGFFPVDTKVSIVGLAKNGENDWTLDDWTNDANHLFGNANGVTATVTTSGAVNFDSGQTYYYPTGDYTSVEYTFLASCPEQPWDVTGNIAKNTFSIDGKTDVLYACAETTDGGYNARYFRKTEAKKPSLEFNHMLTKLDFYLQKGEDANIDNSDLTNAIITKIELEAIPSKIDLTINKSEQLKTDNLTDITNFSGSATITLYDFDRLNAEDDPTYTDATADEVEVVGNDEIPFGYAIVPSAQDMEKQYSVIVYIKRANDAEGEAEALDPITLPNEYLQGNSYNIVLKVYGYRQITFDKATLKPWKSVTNPEDVIDVNN